MQARRYQDKDFDMLQSWLSYRGMKMPRKSWLPKRGWVIDDLCACFLFKTDSKVMIMEHMLSNPKADEKARDYGFMLLLEAGMKEAQKLGMEVMWGFTHIPKCVALALNFGMKTDSRPYFLMRKLIGEENGGSRGVEPGIDYRKRYESANT